jgi:hypothetical protein
MGSIEAGHESEVTVVRDRFLEVDRPKWISSRLITGVLAVCLGQAWMRDPRMGAIGLIATLSGCVLSRHGGLRSSGACIAVGSSKNLKPEI